MERRENWRATADAHSTILQMLTEISEAGKPERLKQTEPVLYQRWLVLVDMKAAAGKLAGLQIKYVTAERSERDELGPQVDEALNVLDQLGDRLLQLAAAHPDGSTQLLN